MSRSRLSTAVLVVALAFAGGLWGQSGTIVASTPHDASTAIDIAYDTTDDTLWVADQFSGNVSHYQVTAIPAGISFIGNVAHPFGPAPFPTVNPRITGVAFNSTTTTSLFVLSLSTLEVVEIDKVTGVGGTPVTLATPSGNTSLIGLTYDPTTLSLWSHDVNNEELLNFDPATGTLLGSIPVPGNVPNEILYGQGVSYVNSNGGSLEVSYGTTLDYSPVRTVQLDLAGNRNGIEANLTQIPGLVTGIARPAAGTALYACTAGTIYSVSASTPTLLPVTGLTCFSQLDGAITLNWTNNGPLPGYQLLSVTSSAGLNIQLSGTASSYTDNSAPPDQLITYTVTGFNGSDVAAAQSTVQTGAGALVDYAPMEGVRASDVALDEASNILYVTDSQTPDRLVMYDADTLTLIGTMDTFVGRTFRGICYNSTTDRLVVSVTETQFDHLLYRIDPLTGMQDGGSVPAGGSQIGPLTYDADNDHYLFIDQGAAIPTLVRVEADENAGVGTVIESCSPNIGGDFGEGVSFLDDGNLLIAVTPAGGGAVFGIQRFEPNDCNATNPSFSLPTAAIGNSVSATDGVLGVETAGNLAYVTGGASNSIFRLLLASSGAIFVRGDANSSGGLPDLSDAIFVASYLFTASGITPVCLDAADANDDGVIDISDALYLIIYEFLMGPEPPAPFPGAGIDPTFLDGLDC